LGDIFSSQYISAAEFEKRARRYEWITKRTYQTSTPLITMSGNHDIGYGDEVTPMRMTRFEQMYGPSNGIYKINTTAVAGTSTGSTASVSQHNFELVIFDSMTIDGCVTLEYQERARKFLDSLAAKQTSSSTKTYQLFVSHIPLYKPEGYCVDPPLVQYTNTGPDNRQVVFRQNTLTRQTSDFIVNSVKPWAVFSGHDHEGCFYNHKPMSSATDSIVTRVIPEYTLRAWLGDYGGNTLVVEILNPEPKHADEDAADNNGAEPTLNVYTCPFYPTLIIMIYLASFAAWILYVVTVVTCSCLVRKFCSCCFEQQQLHSQTTTAIADEESKKNL